MISNVDNLTIHKNNFFIKGKIREYSLNTLKCLNAIYYYVQINKNDLPKDNIFNIQISELRRMMNLENTSEYANIINDSLLQLQEPFTRFDYTDKDGVEWEKKNINIIRESGIKKGYAHSYDIEIHPDFIEIMKVKGDWTELTFKNVQSFRSKNSMKLYEYLSSLKTLPFERKPHLTLDDLNAMFHSKHKYTSKMLELIKRCIKDMEGTDLSDVKCVVDKYNKTFRFKYRFKDTSKQKEAIRINKKHQQKSIEEQAIIDKVVTAKNQEEEQVEEVSGNSLEVIEFKGLI